MKQLTFEEEFWELDKEKSSAFFYFNVETDGDKRYYRINYEMTIRPYPNPPMFGGVYCGATAHNIEELREKVKEWREYVDWGRKHGLTKVEIKQETQEERSDRKKRVTEEYRRKYKPQLSLIE